MKDGNVTLLVGTRKGSYVIRGDASRSRWEVEGPLFRGAPVYHMAYDPRDGKTVYAVVNSSWGGPRIERSDDLGKTWKTVSNPVFSESSGLVYKQGWHVEPGHARDTKRVWLGVEPAGLFWTDDAGEFWTPVDSLNQHPTRDRWQPGAGGLGLHSIAVDAEDPKRLTIGISAAGVFESSDGGVSWRPWNEATRAEHLPDTKPEVGQCVHKLLAHPVESGLYFQRNHFGVYWRKKGDAKWQETTEGLPSDFGFAAAIHPRDTQTAYVIPLDDNTVRLTEKGMAVYVTHDRGKTWKRKAKGFPADLVAGVLREGMANDRRDPVGLYFGTTAGELWGSRDEGESWERIAQYLPPVLSVETAQAG